jgi:hypothetical protein
MALTVEDIRRLDAERRAAARRVLDGPPLEPTPAGAVLHGELDWDETPNAALGAVGDWFVDDAWDQLFVKTTAGWGAPVIGPAWAPVFDTWPDESPTETTYVVKVPTWAR